MRRTPNIRSENQLALALAEIGRLKAITTRVTDGRVIVMVPGTTPGDGHTGEGDLPPIETSAHVLYGSKHTNSFLVTAAEGVSLTVRYQAGQIWQDGTFMTIAASTLVMTDATTNYVFVQAGGVATNTTGFPLTSSPLAEVVAAGGTITAVNDRRSYLLPGAATSGSLHDADQIIDADTDTSVEVERGADDDTIRLKAATVDVALIASAGQWQLPVVGVGAGVLLGGDAQWYRSAPDVMALGVGDTLRIDDALYYLLMSGGNPTINFDTNDYMSYVRGANYYAWIIASIDQMHLTAAGQLQLPITGVGAGLLLGGDVQLYHSAANVLSLNNGDSFSMNAGGMILGPEAAIQFVAGGTNWTPVGEMGIGEWFTNLLLQGLDGMYFVIDPADAGSRNFYWYHGGDTNTGTLIMQLPESGQLQLPIQGASAGLLVGGDCQWYRTSPDVWRTPDSVVADGVIIASGAYIACTGGELRAGADDVTRGRVRVFGPATGSNAGGALELYLAFDHHGVFHNWTIDIDSDDMRFFTSDAAVINKMTAEGQLQLSVQGSAGGLLLGGDVQLYRSAADILYIPDSVAITGDSYWEGDGSGVPYGCMHGYNMAEVVAVGVVDTWYELTAGLVSVEANLMTFQNNHELEVTKAGRYVVNWSASIQTTGANDEIEGAIAINNTADTTTAAHVTMVKSNAAMALGGGSVIDLAAGDDISIAVLNHTTNRDIKVEHVTVTVTMVGGT